jgi:hypothetical protein
MNPKFIIENDNLILMRVHYHIEIVSNEKAVKGGGWYKMDTESKTITFYGKSDAFGAAKLENIKKCVEAGKVFTDKNLTKCIAGEYSFFYKTDYELIPISY